MTQRFVRVAHEGQARHVVVEAAGARLVDGDLFGTWQPGAAIDLGAHAVLAPVAPGKVIGIGRNYRDHAKERAKPLPTFPLVFLKPTSAVIAPGAPIVLPPGVGRVDYESELAIVIGARATRVTQADALRYVFGATCVNDVTARGLQDSGVQFSHAKGYDTFAPLGPAIATGLDLGAIDVEGFVNGEARQSSNTRELIFPIAELVAYVSAIMTLEPGDVIMTGTPAGVGPLTAGDVVSVRIPGIGELSNPVVAG